MGNQQTEIKEKPQVEEMVEQIPRYHVILLNDDDHTYDYVIEMLNALFSHDYETALEMALEVDTKGKVVVDTTHKERAAFKRKQIKEYGPDWRLNHSSVSMDAILRKAD